MTLSYHFSPETGKIGACRAKKGKNSRCPFQEGGHYSTEDKARTAFEGTQVIFERVPPIDEKLARRLGFDPREIKTTRDR